jgi:hypothetical protein
VPLPWPSAYTQIINPELSPTTPSYQRTEAMVILC